LISHNSKVPNTYSSQNLLELLVSCCHIAIGPLLTVHDAYYLRTISCGQGEFAFSLPTKALGINSACQSTYSKNTTMHLKFLQILMFAAIRGHKLKVELTLMGHRLAEKG